MKPRADWALVLIFTVPPTIAFVILLALGRS